MIKRTFRRLKKHVQGIEWFREGEKLPDAFHRWMMYWIDKETEIMNVLMKAFMGVSFFTLMRLYKELDESGGSKVMQILRDIGVITTWEGPNPNPIG